MDLNLQLTNRTKLLIGILGVILIFALATQWGPDMYKLVSNPEFESKQTNLQSTKDLVMASELLKPIQTGLYQKVGLAENSEGTNIFTVDFPNTVVRKKINGIIREAGIPRNYQLNIEPVPGKKSEPLTAQARRNLIVLLYQNKLESEREILTSEMEVEVADETYTEEDMMDTLMNAWLGEDDIEEPEESGEDDIEEPEESGEDDIEEPEESGEDDIEEPEESGEDDIEEPEESENTDDADQDVKDTAEQEEKEEHESTHTPDAAEKEQMGVNAHEDDASKWEFASLPESMPKSLRIELIELLLTKVEQHLVGADTGLFKSEYFKTETVSTPGFFGIGAKKPTVTYNFRPNSDILMKLTNLIDNDVVELNRDQLTSDLLVYLEQIQSQITDLTKKLQLAPTTYSPDSYTIKVKFKTELDKLVKLNRLIETKTKWLMVRDLKVSADKDNKINVDVLMIARVYQ